MRVLVIALATACSGTNPDLVVISCPDDTLVLENQTRTLAESHLSPVVTVAVDSTSRSLWVQLVRGGIGLNRNTEVLHDEATGAVYCPKVEGLSIMLVDDAETQTKQIENFGTDRCPGYEGFGCAVNSLGFQLASTDPSERVTVTAFDATARRVVIVDVPLSTP